MENYFLTEANKLFENWLIAVSNSDGAICISRSVADELSQWIQKNITNYNNNLKIGYFHLGADIVNSIPSKGLPSNAEILLNKIKNKISFLMVSTLEPRKGHAQTIRAFDLLWDKNIDVNLILVGKQGWFMDKTIMYIKKHRELNKKLFWLEEGISDEYLEKIYENSNCLITASEGEGFGLPLIEAAQKKLPIIARDLPVFKEIAGENAYYFSGFQPNDISDKIIEWLDLYKNNKHPKSENISYLTWEQSAKQLMDIIFNNNWYKNII